MQLKETQLSAAARLFSSTSLKELGGKRFPNSFCILAKECGLIDIVEPKAKVSELFDKAFDTLNREGWRNEYIYKSALVHKLLLGVHSLNTSSLLNEFRVGNSKADVVILNGTSTVYEVKSERDNLDRLKSQVCSYNKVFKKVNVITGPSHIDKVVENVPDNVGVLELTKRYHIKTIKKPVDNLSSLDSSMMMDSIRVAEAKSVVKRLGEDIPDVPNTRMNEELKNIFEKFNPNLVHDEMLKVLREKRSLSSLSSLVKSSPKSTQLAMLSIPWSKSEAERFLKRMESPIEKFI